ncbi:hypothetical protein PHMEG_00019962 [Phytophthora megakarya]|uniref:Uncharacterized protein n=1 Tax=Phytophthora megakarya TaxID=4795 RepID=A0A225VSX1_9STRA|nr:hypothetical protein PHMEG_00019962 [Phytophthora megakarya]
MELMLIPDGYTFACQPTDISWNKPLTYEMRKNWVENMLLQLRTPTYTLPFKLKTPSRQQLGQLDAEPDWELLKRLLDEVPVVRHAVDARSDIDTLVEEDPDG